MALALKFIGFGLFQKAMAKRQQNISQRRTVNARAVTVVDRWIQKNFKSQGGNVGGWKPLSAPSKKRGGESAKPLIDTNTLRLKMESRSNRQSCKDRITSQGR